MGRPGGSLISVRAGGEGRNIARLRLPLVTMVQLVSSCDATLTSPSAVAKLLAISAHVQTGGLELAVSMAVGCGENV